MNQKNVLIRYDEIMHNLNVASLEDVNNLLNYYNGETVMIDGMSYHPFNDPKVAARLNARYHELTGQDHPRFVSEVPKVIDGLMNEKQQLLQAGAYTPFYFQDLARIKDNITGENKGIEIAEGKHPLLDFQKVLDNLANASVEEVSQQLNYYNGETVMIDGMSYHPFNDPKVAARLNARYHELTGQDHPRFVSEVPKVIDGLMNEKQQLLQAGAYTPEYFTQLDNINKSIEESTKKAFLCAKDQQRQVDAISRQQQLNQLNQQQLQQISETITEIEPNISGGLSR